MKFIRCQSREGVEVFAVVPLLPSKLILRQLFRALCGVGVWPELLSGPYESKKEALDAKGGAVPRSRSGAGA